MSVDTDLSARIGAVRLGSCLGNASGCLCTSEAELDELRAAPAIGFVVSKSGTVEPRTGNPCPRLYFDERGSINSMGITNLGFRAYARYATAHTRQSTTSATGHGPPVVQSVHPFSLDELRAMLTHIRDVAKAEGRKMMVEVNLSCPNLLGFSNQSVFYDDTLLASFLDTIAEAAGADGLELGLKLPAFYATADFDRVSAALLHRASGIRFVTCFNSVANGLLVDAEGETALIHPRDGLGGIGGSYCKPVGLANVLQFARRLQGRISVIGCGGVESGRDAFEYVLCGAEAVQVGTHLLRTGPATCFSAIAAELRDIMRRKGYTRLADFRGKLRVPNPSPPPPVALSEATRSVRSVNAVQSVQPQRRRDSQHVQATAPLVGATASAGVVSDGGLVVARSRLGGSVSASAGVYPRRPDHGHDAPGAMKNATVLAPKKERRPQPQTAKCHVCGLTEADFADRATFADHEVLCVLGERLPPAPPIALDTDRPIALDTDRRIALGQQRPTVEERARPTVQERADEKVALVALSRAPPRAVAVAGALPPKGAAGRACLVCGKRETEFGDEIDFKEHHLECLLNDYVPEPIRKEKASAVAVAVVRECCVCRRKESSFGTTGAFDDHELHCLRKRYPPDSKVWKQFTSPMR